MPNIHLNYTAQSTLTVSRCRCMRAYICCMLISPTHNNFTFYSDGSVHGFDHNDFMDWFSIDQLNSVCRLNKLKRHGVTNMAKLKCIASDSAYTNWVSFGLWRILSRSATHEWKCASVNLTCNMSHYWSTLCIIDGKWHTYICIHNSLFTLLKASRIFLCNFEFEFLAKFQFN